MLFSKFSFQTPKNNFLSKALIKSVDQIPVFYKIRDNRKCESVKNV